VEARIPVAALISGSGTNLQALLDAAAEPSWPGRIAVVISNRRDAHGLERARAAGVPAYCISHRGKTRREFEADLLELLDKYSVEWIALAGFMRLLSGDFLGHYHQRVLNIHPALLPSFPGLHAHAQALEAGVRVAGATVHLVDEGTDTGPIILQGAVPIFQADDLDSLKARILLVEHQIYPRALRWAVEGRIAVEGSRVSIDLPDGEQTFIWSR
jgi:phosphoribosylglycinamide formyltransferase-1